MHCSLAKIYKIDENSEVKIGVGRPRKFGPGCETFLAKLVESFKKSWNLLCLINWFLTLILALSEVLFVFSFCGYVAANPKLVIKGVFALEGARSAYFNVVTRSLLEQIKEELFEPLH